MRPVLMAVATLALAACGGRAPAPVHPAESACRAAAAAAGLRVTGAAVVPIPAAGLGGAERVVGHAVALATQDGPRRCIVTAGGTVPVIGPG